MQDDEKKVRDNFIEYPKINTIFERDEVTNKIRPDKICREEFNLIKYYNATEKLDGTNIGIGFVSNPDGDVVWIQGRTDNADIPGDLFKYLKDTFTADKFKANFPTLRAGEKVILYGEGVGAGIQKGGGYGKEKHFVLFDVLVGTWWLTPDNIKSVADKFKIPMVPIIFEKASIEEIVEYVKAMPISKYAEKQGNVVRTEGLVCKTVPRLTMRNGEPVMFKCKTKDFSGDKQ